MKPCRHFKIAENEKQLIDSLFSDGGTFDGYVVKRNKRSAVVFLLGKEYTLNRYGVICSMRMLDNGKIWYSYQTDFGMRESDEIFKNLSTRCEYNGNGPEYWFK